MRSVSAMAVTAAVAALIASQVVGRATAQETSAATPDPTPPPVVYTPPDWGAPTVGVAGATKSPGLMPRFIGLLAPGHVGLTSEPQPSLYWYVAGLDAGSATFTLSRSGDLAPLVAAELPLPGGGGIQRIDLADHGVALEPGRDYHWSVVVVLDPSDRSRDLVDSGFVRHHPATAIADSHGDLEAAQAAAAAGYWYDAVDHLSAAIDAAPADPTLRQARAALLDQVNLWYVANKDREALP